MDYKVGPKGQVVIDKEIRDQLGVQPGWTAVQQLIDDHVELYFLPPEHRRSLAGVLHPYLQATFSTSEALASARQDAWLSDETARRERRTAKREPRRP